MIEGTLVGEVAAGAMEYLEGEYADVEGADLLDVVLVLAVRVPGDDGDDDGTVVTHVETGVGRGVPFYAAAGLLHAGLVALGMYERGDV